MAISITFNGVTYSIPSPGQAEWAASLNTYLQALGGVRPGTQLVGVGTAALSPLRLGDDAQPTGPNLVGDIYVTSAGVPMVCVVAGSPGSWAPIGAAATNPARSVGLITHNQQGSTLFASGALVAPGETGSITGPVDDADSLYTGYEAANTLNALCGWRWGIVANSFAVAPRFGVKFKWPAASDITATRTWIGLFQTILNTSNSDASSNYVGLRFTQGTDTTWKLCSSNGVTASETDTGVAPTTAAGQFAYLDFSDTTSLKAYLNGTLIGTKTTHLPSGSALISWKAVAGMTQLAGTVRNLRLSMATLDRL